MKRLPGTAHSSHHNSGRDSSEWNSFPCSRWTSLSKIDGTLVVYRFKIVMFGRIQADGGQFKLAAKEDYGLCELLWVFHSRWIHPSMACSVDAALMQTLAPNNHLLFLERLQEYSAINKVLSDGGVQK